MSSSLVQFIQSHIPSPRSTPKLFHLILIISVIPVLFVIAFGTSIAFYRAYVPQVHWRERFYLQYGVFDNPFGVAEVPSSMILPGQKYDAQLDLVLAPTRANQDLGNFMCNLTFVGRGGASFSVARPVAIVNISPPLLSIWPFARPRRIIIPLMESVALSSLTKPILARIELGRQDGWRSLGIHREVQTVSCTLEVAAVLQGLRWWMYRYPITSVLTAACSFFMAACIVALAAYFYVAPPLASRSSRIVESPVKRIELCRPDARIIYPEAKRESVPVSLSREMVDVSADPSVKSEETEGEMSDWSDAFLPSEHRLPSTTVSSEGEDSQMRFRISRTDSADSLSTLSGDVRRRLVQ